MTARALVTACAALALVATKATGQDMQGLWQATVRLGPDVRGPLLIYRTGDAWRAEVAGFRVAATRKGQSFAFALPDGKGEARDGYWIQNGFATPLRLAPDGPNRWRGEITPLAETYTVFLPITRGADGTLRTYIRNPERNFGVFTRVKRIEFDRADVRLIGPLSPRGGGPDTVLVRGHYDGAGTFSLPFRGATFDFARVTDSVSPFYPRGSNPARYRYAPPLQLADGWPVATLEDVGISRDSIERIVQGFIDMPMDSLGTLQLHDLLIIVTASSCSRNTFTAMGATCRTTRGRRRRAGRRRSSARRCRRECRSASTCPFIRRCSAAFPRTSIPASAR